MAYKGYLIKIGNYIFPLSMIKAESYKATNYGQDLDSTRDVNGILHRTALENTAPKVEFETRNMLDNTQVSSIFANIQANYTNAVEKKASVEVYVPELNKYVTSDMYMADFEPTMYFADEKEIKYLSTRMAWISYGVKTV
jgi:hypothetical protein|nr:MAG TPA: hypothetical protein [Caudoviricetes sp.]DAQ98110.1 MAG TPA: hypothetical protein [Caudoviricetes sp.]DAV51958.1 MAG TPA: hypothetical protein [Caudoviricetes sp.]DAY87905.1 MAG TPA: hypothetical protein [Caudoviricetes sp.]